MINWLMVAFGGALGASLRYWVGILCSNNGFVQFPLATLVVNTLGSFIMGACFVWVSAHSTAASEQFRLFAMVGILGGFTTYSSFSLDTLVLVEQGHYYQAALYVLLTLLGALAGVLLGSVLMRMI